MDIIHILLRIIFLIFFLQSQVAYLKALKLFLIGKRKIVSMVLLIVPGKLPTEMVEVLQERAAANEVLKST